MLPLAAYVLWCIQAPCSLTKDFDPQPKLVLIYWPRKDERLVGLSNCEWLTYSGLLSVEKLVPSGFESADSETDMLTSNPPRLNWIQLHISRYCSREMVFVKSIVFMWESVTFSVWRSWKVIARKLVETCWRTTTCPCVNICSMIVRNCVALRNRIDEFYR